MRNTEPSIWPSISTVGCVPKEVVSTIHGGNECFGPTYRGGDGVRGRSWIGVASAQTVSGIIDLIVRADIQIVQCSCGALTDLPSPKEGPIRIVFGQECLRIHARGCDGERVRPWVKVGIATCAPDN